MRVPPPNHLLIPGEFLRSQPLMIRKISRILILVYEITKQGPFSAGFPNPSVCRNHPTSDVVSLWWGPRFYIFDKLPGDAVAASQRLDFQELEFRLHVCFHVITHVPVGAAEADEKGKHVSHPAVLSTF